MISILFFIFFIQITYSLKPIERLAYLQGNENDLWKQWKSKHNKTYKNRANELRRKIIFMKNLQEIKAMNAAREYDYDAFFDLNKFSDLTEDEFMDLMTMKKPQRSKMNAKNDLNDCVNNNDNINNKIENDNINKSNKSNNNDNNNNNNINNMKSNNKNINYDNNKNNKNDNKNENKSTLKRTRDQINIPLPHPTGKLPDNFSWCNQVGVFGKLNPGEVDLCGGYVMDQGGCGSCYCVGNCHHLQMKWANMTLKRDGVMEFKMFSPQQLLDCEQNGYRCRGGYTDSALDSTHYVATLEDYPYYSGASTSTYKSCVKGKKTPVKLSYTIFDSEEDIESMKQIIHHYGGFVSCVYPKRWGSYAGGILRNVGCKKSDATTHVIDVVGFGKENGEDYIIVRNSWGTDWGINGYVKLASSALCGIGGNDNGDIPVSIVLHVDFSDKEYGPYGAFTTAVDVEPRLYDRTKDPLVNDNDNTDNNNNDNDNNNNDNDKPVTEESNVNVNPETPSQDEGSNKPPLDDTTDVPDTPEDDDAPTVSPNAPVKPESSNVPEISSNNPIENVSESNDVNEYQSTKDTPRSVLVISLYVMAAISIVILVIVVIILHLSIF